MAVQATAIWRVRPSGNNASGGGYDPGLSGAGTDFSQQNAAQVTFNGTTVRATTAGVGATITLVGYSATAADIGNCLHITGGTNFIAGWYFITAQGGTTWTLDRNCTSGAGAAMTGSMGGGWADPSTNFTTSGPVVAGNTAYVLGSGTPNPSSYTYDYTIAGAVININVGTVAPYITWANDPATPGYKAPPDTTGGMPVIRMTTFEFFRAVGNDTYLATEGLWFVGGTGLGYAYNTGRLICFGCVVDQGSAYNIGGAFIGSEFFYSTGTPTTSRILGASLADTYVIGCNIHDSGGGTEGVVRGDSSVVVSGCIIAKNAATSGAIQLGSIGAIDSTIINNTIDGNAGDGIEILNAGALANAVILNNIISNQTGVGKFGLSIGVGTTASNDLQKLLADYNTFYNNTANYNAISAGAHDTALGSDPYVGSATENYTLK